MSKFGLEIYSYFIDSIYGLVAVKLWVWRVDPGLTLRSNTDVLSSMYLNGSEKNRYL